MGWRVYGEPKPKESPVGEFLIGLYLGTFGVYGGGAWALISLGWVSPGAMLVICTGGGLLLGGKLAYDSARRKKQQSKRSIRMDRSGCADEVLLELFNTWRTAESKAHQIFDETNDNYDDPRYIEAEKQSNIALHDFLRKPTTSLHCILLKLRVACQFEDYMADALDPTCTLIGPRAIITAMHDLEKLIIKLP